MKISEKELEDFLFKNLNEKRFEYLDSIGFSLNGIEDLYFYKQTQMGDYGRSDIIGMNLFLKDLGNKKGYSESVVIELKEGCVDEKTVVQALRYLGAIDSSLSMFHNNYSIVLIGSSVSESLEKSTILFNIPLYIYTYNLSLSGISFNCNTIYSSDDPACHDESIIPSHGSKLDYIVSELESISAGVLQDQ